VLRIAISLLTIPTLLAAQTFRTNDSVIRRIYDEGINRGQTERLAQVLIDSIGPRLAGTAGFQSAVDWLTATYTGWGVTARREQYGTWRPWRQGNVSMQLIAPRHQNLEVELLAWSPGTARPVEAEVVALPAVADTAAARAWLPSVRGKFVLVSAPEQMCRAPQELERNARPATVERIRQQRIETQREFATRATRFGGFAALHRSLQEAGAAGLISLSWSNGWGVNKIFAANVDRIPTVDLSCEDYGLVSRLAANNQGPRLRLTAEAQTGGPEVPMFNVVAELRGTELPNEYVLLSAHLDSWAGATGATDNGTGTITMLEAMRILKTTYPNPRRTILVGHWGAEEMGLIGSRAFTEDHPDILQGMQAVFNQDNGTWRFEIIEGQGYLDAGSHIGRWIARMPSEFTDSLRLYFPGNQDNQGSDHSSFVCHGVPAFRFQSPYAEYRQYTWHTNRDTYDKIVFDDLRQNATFAAMVAYLASEDPSRIDREQALLPAGQGGQPRRWPTCALARRRFQQ